MKKQEAENEKKFMDILAKFRPDLWGIEVFRQELGFVDISWLMEVMKQLHDIHIEGDFGDIQISVRGKGKVMIKGIRMRTFNKEFFS